MSGGVGEVAESVALMRWMDLDVRGTNHRTDSRHVSERDVDEPFRKLDGQRSALPRPIRPYTLGFRFGRAFSWSAEVLPRPATLHPSPRTIRRRSTGFSFHFHFRGQ
jgi:hypothetical protein